MITCGNGYRNKSAIGCDSFSSIHITECCKMNIFTYIFWWFRESKQTLCCAGELHKSAISTASRQHCYFKLNVYWHNKHNTLIVDMKVVFFRIIECWVKLFWKTRCSNQQNRKPETRQEFMDHLSVCHWRRSFSSLQVMCIGMSQSFRGGLHFSHQVCFLKILNFPYKVAYTFVCAFAHHMWYQ